MQKDKHKIKTINLIDNSTKKCGPKKNDRIDLSMMMTLLTGDTWYGRYGFLPEDADLVKKYKNNKKIANEMKMKDIPILKDMLLEALDFHRKDQQNFKKNIMEIYEFGYKNNYKLRLFLHQILRYYDRTCPSTRCHLFHRFYRELYTEMKLTKFYGESFIKKI